MRRLICCFTLMLLLSACNTMQGIGRDLESAGNAINRKAEESKH